MSDNKANERSEIVKERFRRAARKVKNYWIFTRRSSFEGFFASKGSAFALPDGDFARKASKHGGEMQMHLQSMVNLLRDDDVLRLVVKLEGASKDRVRYLTVVSAFNEDDIEESIAMGVDWVNTRATCTIGMVLPLWRDAKIELDGDGGFKLTTNYKSHILKPVSVQTMWTAVQWIHRCSENARKNNQFPNGLSHQWSNFYSSHISSDQACINEWHEMEDISSKLIQLPTGITQEEELMMKLIKHRLKEVMMKVDLEEVTSRMIRESLEDEMQMDLKQYNKYIDEEMLTIFGQMDSSSQIYDHVYLGSEWNASNLEELRENGIGYILNISREIDNFFYGTFEYLNIRLYDVEESDLLSHWENTYKFINKAKERGVNVLVHCKMGMSRSASTVIAYGMKEYGLNLHDTMKYVKSKRSVINPNPGFWKQLITYEGILNSSKQRFNPVFSGPGRRRTSSDDLDVRKGGKRRRNRRNQKSKTVTIGEKLSVEPILEDAHSSTLERSKFVVGEDADTEDLSEDFDTEQSSFMEGTSSTEDVLQKWERSLSENNDDPMSSSINHDIDEVGDTVGVLEKPKRKMQSNKVAVLHRARSVPSLHAKNRQSPDESVDVEKTEELHRCTSLHEFLSGKVQKLKEDFKVQSLERQADFHGNLEKRSASHPTSPVGEENKEKLKLQSTLSDPTCLISDDPVHKESETEDNGSSPDQTHTTVVHRDAQGVVKSGTVKRQSKNFEEGRVNLPWEWEEALDVLENSEQHTVQEDTPDSPSSVSEELPPSAEDEPPIGVVKMHAQKFQGTVNNDIKSTDSQQAPTSTNTEDIQEKFPMKEDTQGSKELFGKALKNVNEDMMKEKSRQKMGASGMSIDSDKTENEIISTTIESQESEIDNNEFLCDRVQSEDPLPGTVRKHTQAIEDKYQQLAKASSVEGFEDIPSKRTESEYEAESSTKKVHRNTEICKREAVLDERKDTESFDVDVLLQRVNEDMQREREERREAGAFKDYCSFSLEESMFEDIKPQTENSCVLQEQDDESEIPRPGTVRRNTELLLGKGIVSQDKTEKAPSKDYSVIDVVDDVNPTGKPPHKKTSSPEKGKEADKTSGETDAAGKGLVKRNTLVYEGVLPFLVGDETRDSKDDTEVSPNQEKETECDVETLHHSVEEDIGGESYCGTVKRNTLIFEGRDSVEVEPASTVTDYVQLEVVDRSEDDDDEAKVEKDAHDAVDTSSVVNVKLHLKLLEEVIRKANERETHKQRTTKALADLEDKRKQIEMEQNKLDIENSKEHDLKRDSANAESDFTTDYGAQGETSPPDENLENSSKENSESERTPCVGNVRIRTLQLEERIQGQPLRRHGSMPRTTRPIDRPVIRQRSMSDLQVGSKPSTSREPISSSSPLERDGQTKKNKDTKEVKVPRQGELPDNDRDSEKLSDNMSEKSDKTDDDLKSEDIFDLQSTKIELSNSKQSCQIQDQDNRDIHTI
ncbi:uncharacterized protein LOC110250492 isoform X2 [Exaiptasia diaphana]|uniref:protein-serine/threonine phosphatase n=1 Tax=Exaiptasia diaphana TaxID=2652724 RepID=A0A913XZK4_EXADI|nr:uncharacterized protein LOC110250492 isoform X2 [Exaiptasia diaphana]